MINIYFLNRKLVIIHPSKEINYDLTETLVHKGEKIKEFFLKFDESEEFSKAIVFSDNLEKTLKDIAKNFKYIEAAGGVIRNPKGELLIIERFGKNDLPKGKIEKGEDAEAAAQREIEEECGITNLKLNGEFKPTYHTYWHKKKLVLKKTFWFNYSYSGNEKLVPQLEEDITIVDWVNPSSISKIKQNTYNSIIEVLNQVNL